MITKFDISDVVYIKDTRNENDGKVGTIVSLQTIMRRGQLVLTYNIDSIRGVPFIEDELGLIIKHPAKECKCCN